MNSRELILKALKEIEDNGAYFSASLNHALSQAEPIDRGFVTEVIYGVIKNKTAIDHIIMQFSKVKIKKMSPWVLNILRMGVYQLYFMDKIPASACCNESVKLAKRYANKGAQGFINGLLRNVSRNIDTISFPDKTDIKNYLSVVYSYPLWLVEKLISQYGEKVTEEILKESNLSHLVNIRVNTLKTTRDELISILEKEGVKAEIYEDLNCCLSVKGKLDIHSLKSYKDGLFSLQNISSVKTVLELSPEKGEVIMDICSAPGGKTAFISELMENQGKVFAFDLHPHKIELINSAMKRLGIDIVTAQVHDGTVLMEEFVGKADKVLVDAPCSGIGVIHKKPDIKWTRSPEDIQALAEIQGKILETSSSYVKNGGVLLYSTCTILKEENQEQTEKFLKNHPEFHKLSETQILTTQKGESGFYICKMQRD